MLLFFTRHRWGRAQYLGASGGGGDAELAQFRTRSPLRVKAKARQVERRVRELIESIPEPLPKVEITKGAPPVRPVDYSFIREANRWLSDLDALLELIRQAREAAERSQLERSIQLMKLAAMLEAARKAFAAELDDEEVLMLGLMSE